MPPPMIWKRGLNESWEAVLAPILDPVMEVLEAAEDYEHAKELLADAYPDMDIGPFVESLIQATMQARRHGG